MKIASKVLRMMLAELPNPKLVVAGDVPPLYIIPFFDNTKTKAPIDSFSASCESPKRSELIFEFDSNQNDWILTNFNI